MQSGGSLKATNKKVAIGTNRMYALRDEHGNTKHSINEISKVAERFHTRLYASNVVPGDTTESTRFACEVPPTTKEKIGKALKGMKREKAAGEGGITVNLLEEGGDIVPEILAKLFSKCLRPLKVRMDCQNAYIILIHKKRDTKELKNYRPISLPSVVYKLFTKVIVNRTRDSLDFQKLTEQAGLRKGYSTIDHIHVINQVIEKSAVHNKPLYMAIIEYKKALDSVDTAAVLEALKYQGIDETYIRF